MFDPPPHLVRNTVFVFPQVPIGNYRVDYMIGVAPPHWRQPDGFRRYQSFIVEADGLRYHGLDPLDPDPGKIRKDLEREALIKAETGLDVLRPAGPEITYRLEVVIELLGHYVEGRLAMAMHGLELGMDVARRAAAMLQHPVLRPLLVRQEAQDDLRSLRVRREALDAATQRVRPPVTAADDVAILHDRRGPVELAEALDVALCRASEAMDRNFAESAYAD